MISSATSQPLHVEHLVQRIEARLDALLPAVAPMSETLHRAMRYAVCSGGKRIRPRFLLGVAAACAADDDETELALRAGWAIEFIHTASLVHDDLPCFDDADERRGQPSVHRRFGEPIAVLVGDALVARAFEVLAESPVLPLRAFQLISMLGRATGSCEGIIGGQCQEFYLAASGTQCSPEELTRYHSMKTAALFRLAAEGGAVAAGAEDAPAWAEVGQCLGLAYQLADDLYDCCAATVSEGKPLQRDQALGRPNAVLREGRQKVQQHLHAMLRQVCQRIVDLAAAPAPLLGIIEEVTTSFGGLIAGPA